LFRKKNNGFNEKMIFRRFTVLYSYAEGGLQSENRGFHKNH